MVLMLSTSQNIAQPIVDCMAGSTAFLRLIFFCVLAELDRTDDPALLFREANIRIRTLSASIKHIGADYLLSLVSSIVQEMDESLDYQIDPEKIESLDRLPQNIENLEKLATKALQIIEKSVKEMPGILVVLLEFLYRQTEWKFAGHGITAVIGMFVLRFIMSALAMPEHIGVSVPPSLKGVPMELSKILQFIYNRTNVQVEMFQPLVPFMSQQESVSTQLCDAIVERRESQPCLREKHLKALRLPRENTRQSKKKIADAFLHSPAQLEEVFVRCLAGEHEQQYEFIFEARHVESMILNKELQFNRNTWNENLTAWCLFQFDLHGYQPTEKFFVLTEELLQNEVVDHSLFKDYSMCEVFVRNHISQRVTYLRMERSRFLTLNCDQLGHLALQRSTDGHSSSLSEYTLYYQDGKAAVKPFEGAWDAFLASVTVHRRENAKWGCFELIISATPLQTEVKVEEPVDDFSYTAPFRHTDPVSRSRRKRTVSIKILQKRNRSQSSTATRRSRFLSQTHRNNWQPANPSAARPQAVARECASEPLESELENQNDKPSGIDMDGSDSEISE